MSNDLISFVGWTFLPDLVTTNLQSLYYKLTIRVGDPIPQPNSPTHIRHRQRIYIGVILIYLLYTLYESHWDVKRAGDFYADLGLPHDVGERAIQSRFRRLTLSYHPDKLPASATPLARQQAERVYVHLQLAKDTLVDPAKRFAYDRFGPDITQWQQCTAIRDYAWVGMRNLLPFYIGSAVVMYALSWMGFADWGSYWRYLVLLCLATLELHAITQPTFTFLTKIPTLPSYLLPNFLSLDSLSSLPFPLYLLSTLLNIMSKLLSTFANMLSIPRPSGSFLNQTPYLPFQALRVAHRAAIAFFIALSRLGPLLASNMSPDQDAEGEAEGETSEAATQAAFARLEKAVALTHTEAGRLLALELVPFRNQNDLTGHATRPEDRSGLGLDFLQSKLKDWFVTNTIRSDPQVREAVGRVVDGRRHVEIPERAEQ